VSVCLSVCLSARISPEPHARSLAIFSVNVAYDRRSVHLRQGDEIPRERAVSGVLFPIDNALYNRAWDPYKTAEPIEVLFGRMDRVGRVHGQVMGHSTVSCVITAEPIDMPFWTNTRVGLRNHVLDGGCRSPSVKGNFGDYPGNSKAFWQSSMQPCAFAAKGIIQSPITSCSRLGFVSLGPFHCA